LDRTPRVAAASRPVPAFLIGVNPAARVDFVASRDLPVEAPPP
jgi:hypothetical protein